MRKKPPRVSIALTLIEYEKLEKLANTTERSMSWVGRYAVRRFLEEHDGKQLPLRFDMPDNEQ
jgi:hypothetical protein